LDFWRIKSMSCYIPFPMSVTDASVYLSAYYHMAVSPKMVRRVFELLGDGLKVGKVRLILQETLDRIMDQLEAEHCVFSSETLEALALNTPLAETQGQAVSLPLDPPLSKPQDVVYSSVDERPQEKLGQQVQQPERSQPKFRGRRSTRR